MGGAVQFENGKTPQKIILILCTVRASGEQGCFEPAYHFVAAEADQGGLTVCVWTAHGYCRPLLVLERECRFM